MKIQVKKYRKIIKSVIICFCTLLIIYLGLSIYFSNHFYFGTVINGINVSAKTVEQADEEIASSINSYTLELAERGDVKEQIKATDIDLKYDSEGKTQTLKDSQNSFGWILELFKTETSQMDEIVSYNEDLLKEIFNKLSCFDINNVIDPKSATVEYRDTVYEISEEVYGNKVNKDILYDNVVNAIINDEKIVNLEDIDSYEVPMYNKDSQEVIAAKDTLNQYLTSKITYTIGGASEFLDGSTINKWLGVDENFEVIIDEDKVADYVDTLGSKYNTAGRTRDFVTTSKVQTKISGGNYGWIIDRYQEVQDIIASVKDGQVITKEPKYSSTTIAHSTNDIGNTYIEINFTKQHLWFYKDGAIIAEGDVVTGDISKKTATPTGVYVLNSKEKNSTLRGEDYATPVGFWMPFNQGIGLHDAIWRDKFGKEIYKTNGSHGCINAPYELAKVVYENIKVGTPVVCYYE
nr:L,D-transpeptidase family protein [Clostridium vincentii]